VGAGGTKRATAPGFSILPVLLVGILAFLVGHYLHTLRSDE
jgi:hypothetical protein